MKSAGYGAPVEWHQDWAFYPHTNDGLAAVGIMLDDVDMENGPMLVVPGSHKGPVCDHHGPNGRFCGAIEPASLAQSGGGLDLSRAAPCLAEPGRRPSIMCVRCMVRRPISRPGAAFSAVSVPSCRACRYRLQGWHRNSTNCCWPATTLAPARAGAGAPAPARRASRLDLREPARQRPPPFHDRRSRCCGGVATPGRSLPSRRRPTHFSAARQLNVDPGLRRDDDLICPEIATPRRER